jgi:hypothetical protein
MLHKLISLVCISYHRHTSIHTSLTNVRNQETSSGLHELISYMHAQESNKLARLRRSRIDKGVHAWIIATDVAQESNSSWTDF